MISLQAIVLAFSIGGAGETVLIDFSAQWCGPCRQMEPTVRRLAAQGYPVRQVNIDQQRELAARFHVGSIPCFVMLVNGHEVGRIVGATSHAELEGLLKNSGVAPAGADASPVRGQSPDPQVQPVSFPGVQSEAPLATAKNCPAGDASLGLLRTAMTTTDAASRALAASVRLKIRDAQGNSVGSGTIVDARQGEALVLTCGHIFRDSQGKGEIRVDLFGTEAPPQGLPGRLIAYDLERDLGLVSFQPPAPVTVARVAGADYLVRPNDPVINVGCSHGAPPTVRASRITTIDKFLGPPNLQASGQPVQGRSGGGLFNADGQVIGVCNAADPADNEGLYAALASIHAELKRLGLAEFCTDPRGLADRGAGALAQAPPSFPDQMPPPPDRRAPQGMVLTDTSITPAGPAATAVLGQHEAAALQEIGSRREGAEVICIVRSLTDLKAKSEIIVLDNASPEFLQQLAADRRTQDSRYLTSLSLPRSDGKGATVTTQSNVKTGSTLPWQPNWVTP